MIFVEFGSFARRRAEHLDDEQYRALQVHLLRNPEAGEVIPGTGGLRKVRWGADGRGRRGGVRVIYYLLSRRSRVLLLLLYPKNAQDDLTPEQSRLLRKLVEAELAKEEA